MANVRINEKQSIGNASGEDFYLLERLVAGSYISYKQKHSTLISGQVSKSGDTMNGRLNSPGVNFTSQAINYNAQITVDFDATMISLLPVSGNFTISTSNRATAIGDHVKHAVLRLSGDGSDRSVSFATGIKVLRDTPPMTLPANKIGVVSLSSFGPNETDTLAVFVEEPSD